MFGLLLVLSQTNELETLTHWPNSAVIMYHIIVSYYESCNKFGVVLT